MPIVEDDLSYKLTPNLLDGLDKRRGQVEITAENSARLAHAYGTVTSVGQGTVEIEDRIDFETAFTESPFVQSSHVIDMNDLTQQFADVMGLDVDDPDFQTPLPHCTPFVTEWDQDERDFYLGAWVAVKVSFDAFDAVSFDIKPIIDHHFTFSAIAIKDIPIDVTDHTND